MFIEDLKRHWDNFLNMLELFQVRLVGGRAIPSVVTTTSVVAGLMCLELYKIVLEKPIDCFKHSYLNLAVPMISNAEPIKAVVNTVCFQVLFCFYFC